MGNRIKELRKNKGLTLKELAIEFNEFTKKDRENIKTVSYSTLSRWEQGVTEPSLKIWQKLADYFDVSVSYLQGIVDDDSAKNIIDDYLRFLNAELTVIKKFIEEEKTDSFSDEVIKGIIFGIKISKKMSYQAKDIFLLPQSNVSDEEYYEVMRDTVFRYLSGKGNSTTNQEKE